MILIFSPFPHFPTPPPFPQKPLSFSRSGRRGGNKTLLGDLVPPLALGRSRFGRKGRKFEGNPGGGVTRTLFPVENYGRRKREERGEEGRDGGCGLCYMGMVWYLPYPTLPPTYIYLSCIIQSTVPPQPCSGGTGGYG